MQHSDRSVMAGLAALGMAAGLAIPSTARASNLDSVISGGIHISYTFSYNDGEKNAFGLGADLSYATGNLDGCSARSGGGAYLSATWMNFSYGRFGVGLHGGKEVVDLTGIDAEIGYSRTTAHNNFPGMNGIHLGVNWLVLPLFPVSLSGTIPLHGGGYRPDVTASLGASFPGMLGFIGGCPTEGRPLRVNGQYLLPDVSTCLSAMCLSARGRGLQQERLATGGAGMTRRSFRPLTRIDDPHLRETIVGRWVEAGRGEFASIPAFLVLAEELAQLGAPASLILRALEAAADEHRHATLCFGLAADYAGMTFFPVMPALPTRPVLDREGTLARLALESWEDGCIGEGAASARAWQASIRSADAYAQAAQRMIAHDEHRHAALAWDVLAWCLEVGGRTVRDALAAQLHLPVIEPDHSATSGDSRGDSALLAHGLPSRTITTATWAHTRRDALRRIRTMGAIA